MKIVRILSIIGKNDATSSEYMCEILLDCLRKAEESLRLYTSAVENEVRYAIMELHAHRNAGLAVCAAK